LRGITRYGKEKQIHYVEDNLSFKSFWNHTAGRASRSLWYLFLIMWCKWDLLLFLGAAGVWNKINLFCP